jgi:hypothetical protein
MKTEKQDRRTLCKDATVSFFNTFIVVVLDPALRSHRSNHLHRVVVGLFDRFRPLSFLCWGRHNVKDKWSA